MPDHQMWEVQCERGGERYTVQILAPDDATACRRAVEAGHRLWVPSAQQHAGHTVPGFGQSVTTSPYGGVPHESSLSRAGSGLSLAALIMSLIACSVSFMFLIAASIGSSSAGAMRFMISTSISTAFMPMVAIAGMVLGGVAMERSKSTRGLGGVAFGGLALILGFLGLLIATLNDGSGRAFR